MNSKQELETKKNIVNSNCKHDEKKIEDFLDYYRKQKYVYETVAREFKEFIIEYSGQYAEHMVQQNNKSWEEDPMTIEHYKRITEKAVQQERERIEKCVNEYHQYCSLCSGDNFHHKCDETLQVDKKYFINEINLINKEDE